MRKEERKMGKKKSFTKNNRRCESALSVIACTPQSVIAGVNISGFNQDLSSRTSAAKMRDLH
jgi:hypothetical protein